MRTIGKGEGVDKRWLDILNQLEQAQPPIEWDWPLYQQVIAYAASKGDLSLSEKYYKRFLVFSSFFCFFFPSSTFTVSFTSFSLWKESGGHKK